MLGVRRGIAQVWVLAIVLTVVSVHAAFPQGDNEPNKSSTTTITVRGRVLNKLTNEPIGRALVTTMGDEYGVMTDDRGQFEMQFSEVAQHFPGNSLAGGIAGSMLGPVRSFQAKKPGYLQPLSQQIVSAIPQKDQPVMIYLLPEARIIGHVDVPGTEGEVRITCELYRRQIEQGRERWQPAGSFSSWANGEFRFAELAAGTYRLITHEQMDRDSLNAPPGAEMFGYPPIYYPNTTDFSTASAIVVKAGETAQVNLTVQRRRYFPVSIPVGNAPQVAGLELTVYPMGHWGPGWALGYNPMEQSIQGLLPDGNYTVEANTQAQPSLTGISNFVVRGAPMEGSPLHLVPDASVVVNVHTDFQAQRNDDAGSPNHRPVNIGASLDGLDDTGANRRTFGARSAEGSDNRTLMFDNVRPGRYRVSVYSGDGYVSSIESGGVDLIKQPLVVGLGASVPPIEVTLRSDGAAVTCTLLQSPDLAESWRARQLNGQTPMFYLIPVNQDRAQAHPEVPEWNGDSTITNVPPGDYYAVVFDQRQPNLNLDPADPDVLKGLEGKGQLLHLEAGQKVSLKLKVIPGTDE